MKNVTDVIKIITTKADVVKNYGYPKNRSQFKFMQKDFKEIEKQYH